MAGSPHGSSQELPTGQAAAIKTLEVKSSMRLWIQLN
jgi:hypothetical protein